MKKKTIKAVLILLMVIIVFSALPVSAKEKNVTKAFKNKAKVISLTNEFRTFSALNLVGSAYTGTRMSVGETRSFSFAKNNNRKKVLLMPTQGISINTTYKEFEGAVYTSSSISNLSKYIFGKGTKGVGKAMVGDWGGVTPEIKNIKIYKTGKNKYKVTAKLKWLESENWTYMKGGNITLKIKKKKGSRYGYVATSIKIKKTGKYPEW